jgi:hypothetical protein
VGIDNKLGRVDLAVDLKVEVEQVTTGAWYFGRELNIRAGSFSRLRILTFRVYVQVRKVILSERNQVTKCTQVGFKACHCFAVARYGDFEIRS